MHATTQQDAEYRRNIADLILAEIAGTSSEHFDEPLEFARWAKANKELLVQLFAGQGINRLARIVAWNRRERTGRRRPEELLCYFADLFSDEEFEAVEPVLADRWHGLNDVVRSAMVDPLVAQIVLMPTPLDPDLMTTARTALAVALEII